MSLPRRALGRTGLSVSALGLGCMGMSEFYTGSGVSEDDAIAVIHRAAELGINFLDTADMYGVGMNEALVGRAVRGRREQYVIATKFGNQRGVNGAYLGVNGHPAYVRTACDMSLRRLRIDHIDLYYQHRVDPKVPIEDTVGGMARLVEVGKVRFLGLSEAGANTLRRAQKVHPITALQSEYSLWTRDPEPEVLPTCRELGIGFVAYSPIGRGFLSGAIRSRDSLDVHDWRNHNPRFQPEALAHNLALADKIAALAKPKGCTPAQLALAWLLAQGEDIVPIPGTKHRKYLEENAAAAAISLSAQELQALSQAIPPDAAMGLRYPEHGMAGLNL